MSNRREQNTAWARRKRLSQWAKAAESEIYCPAMLGNRKPCRWPLENRKVHGVTVPFCPQCDRKQRGICLDCKVAPVSGTPGKSLRCAECLRIERNAASARFVDANRAKVSKRARIYGQRPELRERRNAYKKLYRQAHPEKVKGYKRKEGLSQNPKLLDYHRRYNATRAEQKRAEARAQYRAEHPVPTPTCVSCSRVIPWFTRLDGQRGGSMGRPPKRCVFCLSATELRESVKRWIRADERDAVKTPAAPRPKVRGAWKVTSHPGQDRRNAAGDRICQTCETVVSGRTKRCGACKTRDFIAARQALAALRGAA